MAFVRSVVLAVSLLSAAAQASDPCGTAPYTPLAERYTSGLLFKVEKCHEPVSYVFGTVHLARPEVTFAAKDAFNALEEVQSLALELGETQQQISSLGANAMTYPNGVPPRPLSEVLGEKRLSHLLAIMKGTRFDEKVLNRMRPWAIAVLLELVDEEPGEALDEKIHDSAVFLKKPVFGLEKPEDQVRVFRDMPQDLQERMLKESIDEHAKLSRLKQALLKAYINKDMKTVSEAAGSHLESGGDSTLDDYLEAHMIVDRNVAMESHLLPHLKAGSVLVAVGAMHLMGNSGILHLLEKDGYRITPVNP